MGALIQPRLSKYSPQCVFTLFFFFLSCFPDFSGRHRQRGRRSSRFQTDEVTNWVQELKYAVVRSSARHGPWRFSAGYCSTVNNEPNAVWCLHLNTAVRSPTLKHGVSEQHCQFPSALGFTHSLSVLWKFRPSYKGPASKSLVGIYYMPIIRLFVLS